MRLIHKGERGFSLIELVIVIGLTGVVAAGITGAILGVFNTDARTRNDMTAVYQVRQAGKLVSQDILQSQIVDTEDDLGTPEFELLTLKWEEGGTGVQHIVIYTLKDVPSSELKILWREHKIDSATYSNTKIAEHINAYPDTKCEPNVDDDAYTFTVTATVGGRYVDGQIVGGQSETRTYQVKPRPVQQ